MKNNYIYNKRWRQRHPERHTKDRMRHNAIYYAKNLDKRRFTWRVGHLIRKGRLFREPCTMCGSTTQVQACTLSPSPESPIWFCIVCHKKLHSIINDKIKLLGGETRDVI